MNQDEQVRYYDRVYGERFALTMSENERFYSAYFRYLRRRCSLSQRGAGRALDVGCGAGGVLSLLSRLGFTAFGIDFSPEAIAQLRSYGVDRVSCADVQEAIPFEGSFDVITAFEVLEHLYRPEDALARIRGRLAQGGLFVASTPHPGTSSEISHVSERPLAAWRDAFADAGLKLTFARAIRYTPVLWRLSPRLNWIVPVPATRSKTVLYVATT